MKVLFDMGHPAHVHFFKNTISELEKLGHSVIVTARDKDVTLKLLSAYGIPYTVRPDGWRPLNLFLASRFLTKAARKFGTDKLVGVHNPYVAAAAVRLRKPCVLFTDTPGSAFVNRISVGRATLVVTPDSLSGLFARQTTYHGCKEMAYLHPSRFMPSAGVVSKYGLSSPYFVIRFITWGAHHDSGVSGLTAEEKSSLVSWLLKRGQVVASMEDGGAVPPGCVAVAAPEDLHSLLAFSSGYVGEGATMAKEAAVLGVPSVFISPFSELPPIQSMEKDGTLVRLDTLDLDKVRKALECGRASMEQCDVTADIVRTVVGDENRI